MFRVIPGWSQVDRKPSGGRRDVKGVGRDIAFSRRRRPAFEWLEERAMLSVAQDLQNAIGPYQSAINTALSVSTQLPLVGHQFENLQDINTLLATTLDDLEQATVGLANGHHQLAIALPTISHTFTFDLGLDALLQVSTSGGVAGAITPTLNIAFDVLGTSATLDVAQTNLDLGFSLTLPGFQATMSLNGLLYTHAVDQGSNFSGHLRFGFNAGGGVSPQFSGDAHIDLGLTMSFADPALGVSFNPTFHTNFELDWSIDTATNKLKTPQIAFKNFSLDVSSFTNNFLGDIVTTVQKYTKPLQPFIDIFDTPVPILSAFDSSQTIGDLLLQGAGLSSDQKDSFGLMVKVIKAVNTFDLSSSTGGMLNFGDINLTGATLDPNGELLSTFGFDTSQLSGVIDDIFNSPLLDDLQGTLQSVASYAGVTSTAGFQFPVLEDPGSVIGAILTGQTSDMFTFTIGRQHFELAPSIGVGIENVLGVFLSAGIILDANLSVGYDTAGLVKFAQDPLHRPQNLLHGFYFDNSVDTTAPPVPNVPAPKKTAFYLQGFAELSASAIVTLSGGLYANLSVELAAADTSHVYLDDLISNISSPAKIFTLSGQVYAAASIELSLPNPVGPDITLFSYELSKDVLVDFNPPPPPTETKPLIVIDVTNDHTLELDPAKIGAGGAVTVKAFHDYNVGGYLADGIRVDYPGEIHLYVERKNDVTSNYYNLIGMAGAVPSGASIAIIDPFRVFVDEGANDPAPAQTTPSVVLAGGSNVNFRYTEAGDGSHAKVLFVGGYGSSTLTGGTMVFGNFIPTARLDQAKQHFGNTSGFDAAGVALINSSVDAAVAPASHAGIIGATMTASRGGLMYGGPGANSFIATGPGAYEMIGGSWVDTFNITPSFDGVPATYQIDGGGGDSDSLTARIPAGENVVFENSPIADKYQPTFKALAVQANAGLSATAHGLRKVKIVASSGSVVTIGDTSELNIAFSISGGTRLVFGGTNAPDLFNVVTTGSYYDQKNHFTAQKFGYDEAHVLHYPKNYGIIMPSRMADPVYTITRTFGTNGRTQSIPFVIADNFASVVELNAGGAVDTYDLTMGVGAFVDVIVNDTDLSTQNGVTVNVRDSNLINNIATLTDNALHLDYYTSVVFHDLIPVGLPQNVQYVSSFVSSVHYQNAVYFTGNNQVTLATYRPFSQTIVNRSGATHPLSIVVDVQHYTSHIPFQSLGPTGAVFDGSIPGFVTFPTTFALDVQANAGSLSIASTTQFGLDVNVLANSGTVSVSKSGGVSGYVDNVNVRGNTGVINVNFATTGSAFTGHVIVGGAQQNAANVHGTINLVGAYALTIDDRARAGASPNWLIAPNQTQVGDLAINYESGYHYQAFWKADAAVKYRDTIAFSFLTINLNGLSAYPYFPFNWQPQSTFLYNTDGESVNLDLSSYFVGPAPAGTTTYAATNLPPGLSVDSGTGVLSGTIPANSYAGAPYATRISATNGQLTREWTLGWGINSTISLQIFFLPPPGHPITVDEGVPISFDPITANDALNLPVTVTVTGLPPGLSFNSNTGIISGTIPIGTSSHAPYQVHFLADDGFDTVDIVAEMVVSGIQLANVPVVRLNHDGDAVDFNLNATTTSGGTLTYSATGLPPGITLNTATGQITGTLPANASAVPTRYASVTFDDGFTTKTIQLVWTVLQTGVNDTVTILPIDPQSNQVGDYINVLALATTTHLLPLQFTVQGAPPGVALGFSPDYYFNGYNYGGLFGILPPSAALNSPYHVTITATNGLHSASVSFDWQITGPQPPEQLGDFDGNNVVDEGDYNVWRSNFGQSVTPYTSGDGNGDGYIDAADFTVWRDHFGQGGGAGALAAAATAEEPATTSEPQPAALLPTPTPPTSLSTSRFHSQQRAWADFTRETSLQPSANLLLTSRRAPKSIAISDDRYLPSRLRPDATGARDAYFEDACFDLLGPDNMQEIALERLTPS